MTLACTKFLEIHHPCPICTSYIYIYIYIYINEPMLLKRIEYNFAISIVYKVTQPQKILSSDMYGLAY